MRSEWKIKVDTKEWFQLVLANAVVYYLNLPWYFYILVNGSLIGFNWSRTKTVTSSQSKVKEAKDE